MRCTGSGRQWPAWYMRERGLIMDKNYAFALTDREEVSCYFCMQDTARRGRSYRKGEAYLCGAEHSPCNGNSNYICKAHLDKDVEIVDLNGAEWKSLDIETVRPAGYWDKRPYYPAKVGDGPETLVLIKRARKFSVGQSIKFCRRGETLHIRAGMAFTWSCGRIFKIENGRLFIEHM